MALPKHFVLFLDQVAPGGSHWSFTDMGAWGPVWSRGVSDSRATPATRFSPSLLRLAASESSKQQQLHTLSPLLMAARFAPRCVSSPPPLLSKTPHRNSNPTAVRHVSLPSRSRAKQAPWRPPRPLSGPSSTCWPLPAGDTTTSSACSRHARRSSNTGAAAAGPWP